MDNFERISRGSPAFNATGEQKPPVVSSFIPLEKMSDAKLKKLKANYMRRIQFARGENRKIALQEKIDAIDKELSKRRESYISDAVVVESLKLDDVSKQASNVGNNMGLSAIIFGVVGYFVGKSFNKNPFYFAIGGATIGAAGAFYVTNLADKNQKKINAENNKTEK